MDDQVFLKRFAVLAGTLLAIAAVFLGGTVPAFACSDPTQQSCSSSYGVSQTFFGTGGQVCEPGTSGYSANYCANSTTGELGVGNTAGTNYQAQVGYNTDRTPSLTLLANDTQCSSISGHGGTAGSSFNVGYLNTSSVAHVTANFSVKSYLANGYVVKTSGTLPSYTTGVSTHFLTALTNATPAAGTEGFGMNLKANTGTGYGGSAFGFDVSQLPDTTFGFGAPSTGYDTADKFSYANGAQIAASSKSSGVTCYFPSYVFSISNTTPAGQYTFSQSIVVTSTY